MNFELIKNMQQELDNKIKNCRERTKYDAFGSFVAELVEWNETTNLSHKTWKHKEYTREEQLEEFVDMLFFMAQLANMKEFVIDCEKIEEHKVYKELKDFYRSSKLTKESIFGMLIFAFYGADKNEEAFKEALICYIVCAKVLDFSKEDLENEYKRKHAINLERINKKREKGGWL